MLKSHDWLCGYKFLKWGLGFFIFGLIFGFAVLIHYLIGSDYETGSVFLRNITLWFGSPLSLSVSYLQIGGLAMAILGVAKLMAWHCYSDASCCNTTNTTGSACSTHTSGTTYGTVDTTTKRSGGLTLCILGLSLLFITGFIGYFVIDAMRPGFYYAPLEQPKNLWLILQGISLLLFLFGLLSAFSCLCKSCCRKTTY
jgi:hypothetical protein